MAEDYIPYYPYGSPQRPIAHRKATACPCLDCIKSRVASRAIAEISLIGRFIIWSDFLRWQLRRERADWTKPGTMPEALIAR